MLMQRSFTCNLQLLKKKRPLKKKKEIQITPKLHIEKVLKKPQLKVKSFVIWKNICALFVMIIIQ